MTPRSSSAVAEDPGHRIAWLKSMPFFILHLLPLSLFWLGLRTQDLILCGALYVVRMFFITAGYHRYFAHRSYKMGRFMQFLMAFGGATSTQKGPLWWAAHHRHHHVHSDLKDDVHSPKDGFFWSHVGWIVSSKHDATRYDKIKDFAKYPELVWLNEWHVVPSILLATACYWWGGMQALIGGYVLSTVILYHGTFTINSFAHIIGSRRYATTDTSKNSFILALITLGEGWHNNHHYYQSTANQGFFWWEIDISFYVLKVLSWVGLVRDLRTPSKRVLERNRLDGPQPAAKSPAEPASAPNPSPEVARTVLETARSTAPPPLSAG